jgi:hypothetical protein
MARTYKRDGNGRFAGGGGSSGGGGGKRPAAKSVSRGVNRLTRDNAGKITSVGGEGATARGGRLKTAAGNKRATQTAKVSGGRPAGTMKGKVNRDPGAAGKVGQGKAAAKPASKSKTDLQVMQQADRMMGKLAKRQASIQVDKVGLNEGLRQVRRNNARAGRVKTALANRGLLEKYTKLTAPADAIRMTPAGKGIPKPAATPKPTNAAPKSTARPLSQRETQNLGIAKSNLAISKERLAGAREAKATAKGPLEKLKATDRINEQQSNIRQINNKITAINARPAPGRPITGADRSGNRKQLSAPKKSGAIKGSIKRDASATSKLNNKSGLNAGKYKNIYMANANKAAAAKRKRKP